VWVGECFFLYRLTRFVPDKIQRAVKWSCVCVCQNVVNVLLMWMRIAEIRLMVWLRYTISLDFYFSWWWRWCVQMFEGTIEPRTDVWGVGCLMYEMATGLPLFYRIRHQTRERLRAAVSIQFKHLSLLLRLWLSTWNSVELSNPILSLSRHPSQLMRRHFQLSPRCLRSDHQRRHLCH